MPRKLTDAQVTAYQRDGYLSPVTVMSPDDAAAVRKALEQAEAEWPEALAGAGRNNAHLTLTCLDELVHDAGILDAVEDLIGPDILVYGTVLFIKEPQDPGFVSWHQDATYMGIDPFIGVTAWIALSPATVESGCMRMVPGSHTDAIQPHTDTFGADNILTRGQTIENVDETSAVDVVLAPGQLSFHHPQIIHGSRPNRSDHRRIGFTIQSYLDPRARQTLGDTYVQLARGTDSQGHFSVAPRPARDMAPEAVALRDQVNQQWADILYHGAEKQRDY